MIANKEKDKQIAIINIQATLATSVPKTLLNHLYFRAKTALHFFQNSTDQVKIKLHNFHRVKNEKFNLNFRFKSPLIRISFETEKQILKVEFQKRG